MPTSKRRKITIELILVVLVIATIVRQFFLGNYQNMFLGVLTLALFSLPTLAERILKVDIPRGLTVVIMLFIFCAEILGEINAYYTKVQGWDTILHTTNGFLMAAIGFALIDIFNRSERFSVKMSPYFVAFTAFCFSMTIGVLWEFFEFGADCLLGTDMQKDWIVDTVNSVMLRNDGANVVVSVPVDSLVVSGQNWTELYGFDGYLDIGLIDTMKDLLVNFVGAVVFSVIGVFYLKNRKETGLAASLIPQVATADEIANKEEQQHD